MKHILKDTNASLQPLNKTGKQTVKQAWTALLSMLEVCRSVVNLYRPCFTTKRKTKNKKAIPISITRIKYIGE